ncbi:MAG: hypothetical protein IPL79_00580 [Myxococcales bacterium]|nr:hypothetical protein [Myxococcales bacterium]
MRGATAEAWATALAVVVAGVALWWHAQRYWFVTDDAFISLVYARNLAEHGQLVFNLGERVEGYTNFAWTVLLAGAIKLGAVGDVAALWLGLAFGVGTIAGAAAWLRAVLPPDVAPWPTLWSAVLAGLLAGSAGMAAWSAGGLETQLVTCALMWMFVGYEGVRCAAPRAGSARPSATVACWAIIAVLTRPDAAVFVAALGLHRAAALARARAWPHRRDWLVAAAFLLVVGAYLAWRRSYYGYWLPNTYYVKATGAFSPPALAAQVWQNGWYYWRAWLAHLGGVAPVLPWVGAVIAGIGALRLASRAPYVVIALLLYVPYVASVGGDFMGLFRFVMPVTVIAIVAAVLGLEWLVELFWQGGRAARVAASLAVIALLLSWGTSQQRLTDASLRAGNYRNDRGIDTPRFLIDYTHDRARIGAALAPCVRPSDRAIVGGAGAQPYFARLRAIDLFGLVSAEIAHGSPRVSARAGHNKVASNDLLWAYQPTLVFACYDLTTSLPRADLRCGAFWRQRDFEQVTMRIPGLRERGEYYTFWAARSRNFRCPGTVLRR